MRGTGGQRGRGGRGRGGQGAWGHSEWSTKQLAAQNGPLMTDHLQDIDIELEILNRRRQMLQQEQELLNCEREYNMKRQYEYKQPSTSYNQTISNYYNKQGNKRQAVERPPSYSSQPPLHVEPWEQRFQSSNPSFAAKPPPLLGSMIAPPLIDFRPTRSTLVRSNFNPTRVTKPKTRTRYLKKPILPDSKDVRPIESTTTTKSNVVASTAASIEEDKYILRHNVEPSPQLNGRLELALGSILKEMKILDHPSYSQILQSYQSLRTVKKIIRQRIHSVMLDRNVGSLQDVLACYRKKYPVETDGELLKLGKECHVYHIHTLGITPTINSEHIKEFFKANLRSVLDKKIAKLFSQLKENSPHNNGAQIINEMMDDAINLEDSDAEEGSTQIPNADESNDELSIEENVSRTIKKAKYYTKLMKNLLDVELPFALLKHTQDFVALIDADKEYIRSKADVIEATVKEAVNLVKTSHNGSVTDASTANKTIPKETEVPAENELRPTEPQNVPDPPLAVKTSATSQITDNTYYVKLIGRPELPSRDSVYSYLEQFKPASIKKHKTIHNLLVIGFTDAQTYKSILEAGDIIIGENTMTVKASEMINLTPQKQNTQKVNATLQRSKNALETTNAALEKGINTDKTNTNKDDKTNVKEEVNEDDKSNNSDVTDLNHSLNIGQDLEDEISDLLSVVDKENNENDITNTANECDGQTDDKDKKSEINIEDSQTTVREDIIPLETIDRNLNVNGTDDHEHEVEKPPVETQNKDPETETKSSPDPVEVKGVKSTTKEARCATPTRFSSRLASTPSTIKTRRASKLAQNQ